VNRDASADIEQTPTPAGDQASIGERAGTHTGEIANRGKRLMNLSAALSNGLAKPGDLAGAAAAAPGADSAVAGAPTEQPASAIGAASGAPAADAGAGAQQGGGVQQGAGAQQGGANPGGVPPSQGDPTQGQGGPTPRPTGSGAPPNPPPSPGPGGTKLTAGAQALQQQSQDALNAQAIYYQMAADRQKAQMDIWKILQDMQTWIFQKMQEAMIYRQQVQDKMSEKWAAVLGGYSQ
jgi:hypothetical protein